MSLSCLSSLNNVVEASSLPLVVHYYTYLVLHLLAVQSLGSVDSSAQRMRRLITLQHVGAPGSVIS